MKKGLFICGILVFVIFQINGQTIPNAGFENWTMQANGYEDPDNWATNNLINGISVSKTADSYSGNLALQVINNYPWFEGPLTGSASVFYSDTELVTKILAFVKCDSITGNGGSGVISIVGYTGSTPLDLGRWETTTEIVQYSLIEIPLAPVAHYDSIGIYIMATGLRDSLGFNPGHIRLIVDELSKETVSAIDEVKFNQSISVSPNPYIESTVMTFDNHDGENSSLTIFDAAGNLLRKIENITWGNIKVERKDLQSGVYSFKIQSGKKNGSGTFIVQ